MIQEIQHYRPYSWLGELHDAHLNDYKKVEVDRANKWFASLERGVDEMGVMIFCSCGAWTFPSMARHFAFEHWRSCGCYQFERK